jgi:type IV secretory pathway TraG/TraD family ATPase VirD4
MSKLILNTLKFFGKAAKKAVLYAYAQRLDTRHGTGFLHTLLTGTIGTNRGARFLNETEQLKLFADANQGLLIDGKQKRLTLDESYKHLLLVAQTGAGKTTKYIIPNVLRLADTDNSVIVTDPSGEIFSQTSGYMQSKGFKVLKFDPTDPEHSIYFNPLRYVFSYANGHAKVDQVKAGLLAASLTASCLSGGNDAFWKAGAESLIEFFTCCLQDTPKEYHNLYNVYKLLEAMTPDGKLLDKFMLAHVNDKKLLDTWVSLTDNFNPTLQGQLASAQTALKPLRNEHIAKMLSKNTIRFSDLKKEKTILYLTFPVNEATVYTFILNLFYTQLFHEYMNEQAEVGGLPLFILYDEFGHANIPDFDIVATNIRKYKVSLSLVLQSLSQLETQYGKTKANTILEGGIGSKLFYSGASEKTAQSIEQMLGKVIREETYTIIDHDERTNRQEFNLLNADEIRTLPSNQAFFITGNKKPVLLEVTPHYNNREFKRKKNYGEAHIPMNNYYKFELKSVLDET